MHIVMYVIGSVSNVDAGNPRSCILCFRHARPTKNVSYHTGTNASKTDTFSGCTRGGLLYKHESSYTDNGRAEKERGVRNLMHGWREIDFTTVFSPDVFSEPKRFRNLSRDQKLN